MRIIAGEHRGRRFMAPKKLETRPTTDFAKEGLFNVLSHRFYFQDLNVLDLFAGIGSISLEFISRGTQEVTSVEHNSTCTKFIAETAHSLEIENIHIIKSDVYKFLETNLAQRHFNLIFANPPFSMEDEDYQNLIELIFDNQWIDEKGVFILEHSKKRTFEAHPKFQEEKKYSNIKFSFFK